MADEINTTNNRKVNISDEFLIYNIYPMVFPMELGFSPGHRREFRLPAAAHIVLLIIETIDIVKSMSINDRAP